MICGLRQLIYVNEMRSKMECILKKYTTEKNFNNDNLPLRDHSYQLNTLTEKLKELQIKNL